MAIHIGLIGGGNITETHARAARAIPGVEIAAIYGTNAEKVDRLCKELSGEYEERGGGLVVQNVAGGWRLATHPDTSEVVARYPAKGQILQSGWLLGEDLLRDQANVVAFRVGRGYVVTLGSQVDFRAQPRATFKLLFNAMFHGPSTRVTAADLAAFK